MDEEDEDEDETNLRRLRRLADEGRFALFTRLSSTELELSEASPSEDCLSSTACNPFSLSVSWELCVSSSSPCCTSWVEGS